MCCVYTTRYLEIWCKLFFTLPHLYQRVCSRYVHSILTWCPPVMEGNGPTTGPLPISHVNNSIWDFAYLFRTKPLPKSNFGLVFGWMQKSKNFLATHSDYLSNYFRQDYLILVLSSLQCKNNCRNQIWVMIIYCGEIVKTKIRLYPLDESWICFCLLSRVNTWIRILNSSSDICSIFAVAKSVTII